MQQPEFLSYYELINGLNKFFISFIYDESYLTLICAWVILFLFSLVKFLVFPISCSCSWKHTCQELNVWHWGIIANVKSKLGKMIKANRIHLLKEKQTIEADNCPTSASIFCNYDSSDQNSCTVRMIAFIHCLLSVTFVA